MSLTLLIADDEYFIRQKIKKIIPYEELGLTLVGECENGQEAVDLLSAQKIDIILLDIRMPRLSGLEVAQYVFTHELETRIIILSGFNDFEYARTTFRYGVFDYLLKPVETEALTQALRSCIEKMLEEKEKQQQLDKFYHYRKCRDLSDVLRGSMDLSALKATYTEFKNAQYALFLAFYTVMECEACAREMVFLYRDQDIDCEYFMETEHIFYIQFFLEDPTPEPLCQYLCKKYVRDTKISCYFLFSRLFDLEESWLRYQKETLASLGYRYFTVRADLAAESFEDSAELRMPEISDIRQNLNLLLNTVDTDGYINYTNQLFRLIESNKSYACLNLIVTELLLTFSIRFPDTAFSGYRLHDYIRSLLEEEHELNELKETLVTFGLKLMNTSASIPSDLKLCKKITGYIQEHYAEPDLTVTGLAELFHLNLSYMGSIFKKVNDLSILQYLTQVRMEESRKLLKSQQYKVGEVAEMVGFTDVFYYSKRFKKMYGYSPKEFITSGK